MDNAEFRAENKNSKLRYNSAYTSQFTIANKQCFKISSKMRKNQEIDFQTFEVQMAFKMTKHAEQAARNLVFLTTSEENSYGLAGDKWFDGFIEGFYGVTSGSMFQITEVTEYKNLVDYFI